MFIAYGFIEIPDIGPFRVNKTPYKAADESDYKHGRMPVYEVKETERYGWNKNCPPVIIHSYFFISRKQDSSENNFLNRPEEKNIDRIYIRRMIIIWS